MLEQTNASEASHEHLPPNTHLSVERKPTSYSLPSRFNLRGEARRHEAKNPRFIYPISTKTFASPVDLPAIFQGNFPSKIAPHQRDFHLFTTLIWIFMHKSSIQTPKFNMKTLNIKVWKRRSLLEIIIFMFHVKMGEPPPVLHLLSLVEQSQGFSEPQVLSNHCKKKPVLIGTMGRCTCFFG